MEDIKLLFKALLPKEPLVISINFLSFVKPSDSLLIFFK